MMKRIKAYLTLFMLIFSCQITAQKEMDSLLFYYNKGNYNKTIVLGEKIRNKLKNDSLTKIIVYSNVLSVLSGAYLRTRNIELPEDVFKEAVKIEKIINENKLNHCISLYNLAHYYDKIANFELAISSLLDCINILESNQELNEEFLIDSYTRIAQIFQKVEDFDKAQKYYLKSYERLKPNINNDLGRSAGLLSNIGVLHEALGNFPESEKFYLKAVKLLELKPISTNYSRIIGNLGLLYLKQNKLSQAKLLFEQQIEINKNLNGENSLDYARARRNLASYYNWKRDGLQSIKINTSVLKIIKDNLGENNNEYVTTLNHLANSYMFTGDYKQSEELFLKSLLFSKENFGESSYSYQVGLNNLIELFMLQNKYLKASKYIELSFEPFKNKIKSFLDYTSTKELTNAINKFRIFRLHSLMLLEKEENIFPEVIIGCYEREIFLKSLILRNQKKISKSIDNSGNKELKNDYKKFIRYKRELARLNEVPIVKRPSNYLQILSETESLEKYLVRKSSTFSEVENKVVLNWKQIQDNLGPNELSIDLIAFNYYNKKMTDSIVYSAFIVGEKSKFPKYISLFEEKQLKQFFTKDGIQSDSIQINKQYTSKSLSDLFLKPLAKDLEGVKSIYLSSYGLGHQVDFSALPISDQQTFGEKYNVHILSSPAELVDYKVSKLDKASNIELLLYGGIDYNKSEELVTTSYEPKNTNINATLITRSGIKNFGYLNGTNKEIESITLNAEQNGFKTTLFRERIATETSIKKLDGRTQPFVLHLATHGFFFPDPEKDISQDMFGLEGKRKIYKRANDPMMRSGLLFAGANKFWGKPNDNQNKEDGILTASEISNLDLSACELVVLSACETGLGKVQGSEGVFGLQRAFKMAGVKNIIMSLWKVPDAQTAELFDIFYEECFKGKSIHKAFQTAQSTMKEKYSPYFWAGFVLLE